MILPRFAEQVAHAALAGRPLTRDMAGRASVYLQARTHYGVVDPSVLVALRGDVAPGARRRATCARSTTCSRALIWIADGELDALDDAARALPGDHRRARPAAPVKPTGAARPAGRAGRRPGETGGRRRGGELQPVSADRWPTRSSTRSTTRAPASSSSSTRTSTSADCSSEARDRGRHDGRPARAGTGLPGGRMPDRGVDRPPFPDEIQQARRYATRLRQAHHRRARADRQAHPGRALRRARLRARPARSAPPAGPSAPTRGGSRASVRAPIEAPHVGLVIDTSGSMGAYEYALGPIAGSSPTACARSAGAAPARCSATAPSCSPTAPRRCRSSPGSRPGAGRRSPATRSSSRASSWR